MARDDRVVGTPEENGMMFGKAMQVLGGGKIEEARHILQDVKSRILTEHDSASASMLPHIEMILQSLARINQAWHRTASAVFDVDVIESRKVASEPGGHKQIRELCERMRDFVETNFHDHGEVSVSQGPSKGDNVIFRLEAASVEALADLSIGTAIEALKSAQDGRLFRYVIYRLEELPYQPRIKVFEDITKTPEGKSHHIAVDRGLVASVANAAVLQWLKRASHATSEVRLQGEPIAGVYFDFYDRLRSDPYKAPTSHVR
jgi:hypothetical protein